jgi:hypothetical protein
VSIEEINLMRLPRIATFGIFFCALFLDYQLDHQSGVSVSVQARAADSFPSKKIGTGTPKKRSLTAATTMAATTSNMRQRKSPDASAASIPTETRGGSTDVATSTIMPSQAAVVSGDTAPTVGLFSKIRRTVFPIYGNEVTKFLLIGSIKVSADGVHLVKE